MASKHNRAVAPGLSAPLPAQKPPYQLLAIIDARLHALGLSERRACLASGLKPDAIRTLRRGHRPTLSKLRRLAEALDVPLHALVEAASDLRLDENPQIAQIAAPAETAGSAAQPKPAPRGHPDTMADVVDQGPAAPPGYAFVSRLSPGIEGTGQVASGGGRAEDRLLLPIELIRDELNGEPEDFAAVQIEGPAMSPILESGDKILIDRRRCNPVQPGIFAIDEGLGPAIKWVEVVAGSEPALYRVRAENPRFREYEIPAERARIIGRVVWFTRRL